MGPVFTHVVNSFSLIALLCLDSFPMKTNACSMSFYSMRMLIFFIAAVHLGPNVLPKRPNIKLDFGHY